MYGIFHGWAELTDELRKTDDPDRYILSGSAAFARTMTVGNSTLGTCAQLSA